MNDLTMPIVDVTADKNALGIAKTDLAFLTTLISKKLSVEEWPIYENHISIRFYEVDGELIGDIEVVLSAHCFPARAELKDEICTQIRSLLEERWKQEVRVWLQLFDMGYGTKVKLE